QHRLPRRRRGPLLLGAVRIGARGAGSADFVDNRRALPAGRARHLASALVGARTVHDEARAHAEGPPEAPGVDAVANSALGGIHRPEDEGTRRGHPRRPPAPGDGVPLVPWDSTPRQALWARAAGGGLRAGRRGTGTQLPARRRHPEAGLGLRTLAS